MRLHDKLGRLLQSGAIEGEGGGKAAQPPPRWAWLRVALVLLGFLAAALGDAALAVVADDTEQMHLLSGEGAVVWRASNSAEVVESTAQWGPPVAPFVFDGGVLHVGASLDAAREFRIRQWAYINVHDGAVFSVLGKITGDSSFAQGLTKLGAGTLRLAGDNDYRGVSMLLQGGLHLATGQALGRGYNVLQVNTGTRLRYEPGIVVGNSLQFQDIDVALYAPAGSYVPVVSGGYADSVQWFVDGGTATQTGSLSGWAPIVKQGAGTLRFSGDAMAYDGLFTVNQGVLAIDGDYAGPVRVNGGAQLRGMGQVGATTVMAGGVLAPDTLTVRGVMAFQPGAGFQVRVAPSGWNTSLRVTGKALLDGKVMALAQSGDWKETTRYTLLHAEGGFDGTRFASVDTDMAFLSPSLEYDAQKVYLVLERNGTGFDDVADGPDEDVADAVDDPDDMPDIHDEIVPMTRPQAREAFRQLSGNWYGSVQSSIADDSRFLREAVWANANSPSRGWGRGYFSSSRRANADGVDGDFRELGGAVLGLNWPVGSRAGSIAPRGGRGDAGPTAHSGIATGMAGTIFFGAQQSRLQRDANMAQADIGSLHAGLGLAGAWHGARWVLGAAHSWHDVDSTRKIAVRRLRDSLAAGFSARTVQLFGQARWPFTVPVNRRFGRGAGHYTFTSLTITPFVRATGLRLRVDGFAEDGGPAALAVAGSRATAMFSTLGIGFEQGVRAAQGGATLSASLAWRHAAGADVGQTRQHFRDSVRGKTFVTEGLPMAANVLQLELGLRARIAKTLRLGLSYAGQFASGLRDHGVRLNLGWAF